MKTPTSLNNEKTRRFFKRLADDPFIAIVVDDEGELQIFTKGIDDEHLERIRTVLREIVDQEGTA